MFAYRLRIAALATIATAGLAACTTPYGYNGVGVGVGSGYYGSQYGYGYGAGYPGYGYGYGAGYPGYGYGYAPYWGWNDGFYYPGSGYYVYDRYRRPYPWNDDQRRYWEGRREQAMSSSEFRRLMEAQRNEQNWSGFDQGPSSAQRVRSSGRSTQIDRSNRVSRSERNVTRAERRGSRQSSSDFRRSMEQRTQANGDD